MQVKQRYKDNNKNGYLIVEMMISISLIIVGLLGVFSLLTRSYAMQQPLIDQYTATYLAAEGIEVTKNFIDHNIIQSVAWNTGLQVDGDYGIDPIAYTLDPMLADRYLKLDPDTGLYTYQMGDNTKFKRVITVENISADELRITSRVVWNDKKGRSQEVVLEDHFFNWR